MKKYCKSFIEIRRGPPLQYHEIVYTLNELQTKYTAKILEINLKKIILPINRNVCVKIEISNNGNKCNWCLLTKNYIIYNP